MRLVAELPKVDFLMFTVEAVEILGALLLLVKAVSGIQEDKHAEPFLC